MFDEAIEREILLAIDEGQREQPRSDGESFDLYSAIRYHLGFVNASFVPERGDAGKRLRPRLCVLSAEASGADPLIAMPAAAAIELLHNFTLVHDDIQDQSPLRRHRETVWHLWGVPQAINTGDAMFAIAHMALNRSLGVGVPAETVLSMSSMLHRTTLRIVEGQARDLAFETREDVSTREYLDMIGGKTAAICHCACWIGGIVAGLDNTRLAELGDFGFALGTGFQVRDDFLGVWGTTAETGKAEADDIRRRKRALPALLLAERADADDLSHLLSLYRKDELSPGDIETVLCMMTQYEIRDAVQDEVRVWHDRAADRLESAVPTGPARDELAHLVRSLETRRG